MAKKKYYKKAKTPVPADSETFRDLYFRTVDKLYENAFTRVLNHNDTISILLDTYMVMYDDLKSLRKAPSLMWWLRKCSDEGYKRSMRSKNISFMSECLETDDYPTLTDEQKMELWHRIIKMRDINEYVLVPVPSGVTHEHGGLFGPLISRIKSTTKVERLLIVGIFAAVVIGCAAIFVAAYKIVPYFTGEEKIETQQEIFLPDSAYEGIVINDQDTVVDDSKISSAVLNARDKADYLYSLESHEPTTTTKYFDPEWASMPDFGSAPDVASMETMGQINGSARLTGDEQFDAELVKTMNYLLTDGMSDRERVAIIYSFVCHYGSYKKSKNRSSDIVSQAKSFFANNGGDSNEYAAAFKVLCNAAGYDCDIVSGEFIINNSDGTVKYVEHTWAKVILNGIEYHCDPEADCSADGQQIRYYYMLAARGTSRWEVFQRDHRWKS